MDLDTELQAEVDAVMAQWDSGNLPGWPVFTIVLLVMRHFDWFVFRKKQALLWQMWERI